MNPLLSIENYRFVNIFSPTLFILFEEITSKFVKFYLLSYGNYRHFVTPGKCAKLSEKLYLVFDPILEDPLHFVRELAINNVQCFIEYNRYNTDIIFNDSVIGGDILILNDCYIDGECLCFSNCDPLVIEKFSRINFNPEFIVNDIWDIFCLNEVGEPEYLKLDISELGIKMMDYFSENVMVKV